MPDSFTDSVWTRPHRTRGEQPTLSRAQIVRAAIELLDAEGPAGLSMRRLGTRLGAGATSLYWHVANKDDLLELAVDEVMGEIYVPDAADTGWRMGASILATGMRAMLLRHPWVIARLGTRPTLGPNAMRIGDRTVALLTAAGFTGMELSHAIGAATTIAAAHRALGGTGLSRTEAMEKLQPYLDRAAADHPAYDKWRRETGITGMDPQQIWDDGFNFGLERLLDGLAAWLARQPATTQE